jgi:hypothetical protein
MRYLLLLFLAATLSAHSQKGSIDSFQNFIVAAGKDKPTENQANSFFVKGVHFNFTLYGSDIEEYFAEKLDSLPPDCKLKIDSSYWDQMNFFGSTHGGIGWDISLLADSSRSLVLNGCHLVNLNIQGCKIDTLDLSGSTIDNLLINTSTFKCILMRECNLQNIYISGAVKSTMMDISALSFTDGKHDLTTISLISAKDDLPTLMFDFDTKLADLDIDLCKYNLAIDTRCTDCNNPNNYQTFYINQLAYLHNQHKDENYKALNKNYHWWQVADRCALYRVAYFHIPNWFYGFGDEKSKLIPATFELFLISVLIFFLFYNQVNKSYTFETNEMGLSSWKPINNFLDGVAKTSIIFFGVKLDYKKIKFESGIGLIAVLFIFILGIICYAFLANFIFTVK